MKATLGAVFAQLLGASLLRHGHLALIAFLGHASRHARFLNGQKKCK
jgi:hypothetical protein